MRSLKFVLVLIAFNSLAQEKPLDVNKHLFGKNLELVKSYIKDGNPDLYFVMRTHYGIHFDKTDTCREEFMVRFILLKTKDSETYRYIKLNECGQTETVQLGNSLKYFESNRSDIRTDSFEGTAIVLHTPTYSFYEFKNGELMTYRYFCKDCVDEGDAKTLAKDQDKKTYKFFVKLDAELSALMK